MKTKAILLLVLFFLINNTAYSKKIEIIAKVNNVYSVKVTDISTNCSAGGDCCAESNFGKVCLSNDGLYNENVNGRLVAEQALTEPSTLTQPTVVTNPPTQVATTKLQATPINQ